MQQLAAQTGLTTQAFSGLSFAVNRFGLDAEGLRGAIARSNELFIEARDGTTTYVDDLAAVGIAYQDLENLDPAAQFFRILQGVEQAVPATERLGQLTRLLGTDGENIAGIWQTLGDNAVATLDNLQQRYQALAAPSDAAARGASLLGLELTLLNDSIGNNFLAGVIDGIEDATGALGAGGFDSAIRAAGRSAARLGEFFVDAVAALFEFRREIGLLIAAFLALKVAAAIVAGLNLAIAALKVTVVATVAAFKALAAGSLAAFAVPIATGAAVVAAITAIAVAARVVTDNWAETGRFFGALFDVLGGFFSGFALRTQVAFEGMAVAISDIFRSVGDFIVTRVVNPLLTRVNSLILAANLLTGRFGGDGFATFGLLPAGFGEADTSRLARLQESLTENARNLTQAQMELGQAGSDLVTGAIETVRGDVQSIGDFFGRIRDTYNSFFDSTTGLETGGGIGGGIAGAIGQGAGDTAEDAAEEALAAIDSRTIADELRANLQNSFSSVLRDGDFQAAGDALLANLQAVFADRLSEQIVGGIFGAFGSGAAAGATPTFHEGGIVGGRRGQEVPAILEAGELVLTQDQQADLFNRRNLTVQITAVGDIRENIRASLPSIGREIAEQVSFQEQQGAVRLGIRA